MTEREPDEGERRPRTETPRGGRSRFWVVLGSALLTLLVADRVAWWIAPPRNLREVEDAVQELRGGDPTVLAIGSSHGRTFAVMGDSLRARTQERERMLAVPVEWGKLTAYRWVLEHRLLPLLDERGAAGTPVRTSLRRAIIVTEWWDSCPADSLPRNLPARAWAWPDYVADVRQRGMTSYNDNFLGYRWSRFWRRSALVQDRGHGFIRSGLRRRLLPASEEALDAAFASQAAMWQGMVEAGSTCLGSPSEMAALVAMVDTLQRRGTEVTVVLYPRMPVTLTPRALETTLPGFAARVRETVEPMGVRVVDLSSTSPVTDDDFGADFDHLLPAANARFSGWALDGPLDFLIRTGR